MMKFLVPAAALSLTLLSASAFAGKPENPGIDGRANAFGAPGFGVASDRNGKGLDHAADIFGDNGKGNGADPDSLDLAPDHDPGAFGGSNDSDR